jgi:Ca2+-binding EF-hand superfamily protein
MQTLVDAFLFFDKGNHGWITRADVAEALGGGEAGAAGAHAAARSAPATSERPTPREMAAANGSGAVASRRRFSEMDFDGNGRVSFPEFVAALEGWAGVEEEE